MTEAAPPRRRRWVWPLVFLGLLSACLLRCTVGGGPALDASGGTGAVEVRELALRAPPSSGPGRGGLGSGREPTMQEVFEQLRLVEEHDSARGVFLRIGSMGSAWGRVSDLVEAIERVRATGKPVHCHFDSLDNAGFALAVRACDRLSMTPAGHLNLVGVAAQVFYARELLDSVGVRAEVIAMGRFKSAGDMLTETTMPEAAREATEALLDDVSAGLVNAVALRFEGDAVRARAAIDAGPYGAEAARAAGLIDAVAFDDEAREHARRAGDAPKVRALSLPVAGQGAGLGRVLEVLMGEDPRDALHEPHVAIVHVTGSIVDGEEQSGAAAVSGPFVEEVRRLADDESVRAVVLRIDSPGGSALASDRMWHAVRRLAARKPVVASLGDVAASGGYYIGSAAREIYAHPASIVGSIGVIGGKADASGLFDRLGVRPVVITRGARAAWMTPTRGLTEDEHAAVSGMLRSAYQRFLGRVSAGRDMPRAAVHEVAQGRVMSGLAGHRAGLVDTLGGLTPALARARELGELPADAPFDEWPRQAGMFEALAELAGGGASTEATTFGVWMQLAESISPEVADVASAPLLLCTEPVLTALPYSVDIR
ncbi:MAG: signal peptide peptidase SppA [Sandaracinaceae bacterium]|jgi:protease-4|nr:signal peptide peptidase SppA [Sandaracinaceae bacterium]